MSVQTIFDRYYPEGDPIRPILWTHSRLVADKALEVGRHIGNVDLAFIEEAALLHDIGIRFVHAPKIHCHGEADYICHGPIGRELLEKEGLPQHALVCDRHTGVGITIEDIRAQELPIPERDMTPQSLEEQIICYADTFYSKNPKRLTTEREVKKIIKGLERFGDHKVAIFRDWHHRFEG